jgi:hypothetical protein
MSNAEYILCVRNEYAKRGKDFDTLDEIAQQNALYSFYTSLRRNKSAALQYLFVKAYRDSSDYAMVHATYMRNYRGKRKQSLEERIAELEYENQRLRDRIALLEFPEL